MSDLTVTRSGRRHAFPPCDRLSVRQVAYVTLANQWHRCHGCGSEWWIRDAAWPDRVAYASVTAYFAKSGASLRWTCASCRNSSWICDAACRPRVQGVAGRERLVQRAVALP